MLDFRAPPSDFTDNPFPHYAALRAAGEVVRAPDGSWLVTSHRACADVYRHPSAFSSDKDALFRPKYGATPLLEHHTSTLVFRDPPYHTRVRQILVNALKPKQVQGTISLLTPYVTSLLGELRARGEFDAIADFAARIPVLVICHLLGVPREHEPLLRDWSLAILGALEPSISPVEQQRGDSAVTDFLSFLREFIDDCGAGRAQAGDVLAALLLQSDAGDISELELLHNCIFLLNAGHETTTNLIGNGVHMLLSYPEQGERLRLATGARASVSTVEEVLRFQSPNQLGNREVVAPVTVAGVALEPGMQLTLCIGCANRDEAVFPRADEFDVLRSPNPHLAFAAGAHACAGMALARVEGRIALRAFVQEFPKAKLLEQPRYQARLRFRGLTGLQVGV